jgi:hypothetical protein
MSLLRELVDEKAFREDEAGALLDAALLVVRSGLQHLVSGPTRSEVLALARAGEIVAKERVGMLLTALEDAPGFMFELDGGARARAAIGTAALAASRSVV